MVLQTMRRASANLKTHRYGLAPALLCVAAAMALSGCSLFGESRTALEASLAASATANPNAAGEPAPVAIRLYELKSRAGFENASFFELFDSDLGTLAADLVERHDFTLEPGGSEDFEIELKDGTAYLGVLAAFRDIDQAEWRQIVEIESGAKNEVEIKLDAKTVRVQLD